MSNRIFQGLVHQMRDAVGRTLGVIDETGTIIACSELSKIGEVISTASEVFGDGGLCLTQALIIDDGSTPLTYSEDVNFALVAKEFIFMFKSTRFWTIIIELYRMTL